MFLLMRPHNISLVAMVSLPGSVFEDVFPEDAQVIQLHYRFAAVSMDGTGGVLLPGACFLNFLICGSEE